MSQRTRLLVLAATMQLLAGCASYSGILPAALRFDEHKLTEKSEPYAGWPKPSPANSTGAWSTSG